MSKREKAIAAINDIATQNKMAPPDFFGEKSKDGLPYGDPKTFGTIPENPIPCNDVYGEECYLSRLREDDTEAPVIFHRIGSAKGKAHMIDAFECITTTGNYVTLYMDMYYYGQSMLAPKGFHLAERATGLTGTSAGAVPYFPDVFRYVNAYSASAYGAGIADEKIRLTADQQEQLKGVVTRAWRDLSRRELR